MRAQIESNSQGLGSRVSDEHATAEPKAPPEPLVPPRVSTSAASEELRLRNGSRVAVVGGGPAGSFFAYFLLRGANRFGLEVELDLFEPRSFENPGPASCNMCGGIVSESLLQKLSAEGIVLPPEVIEGRLDSYVMHMDVGTVRIQAPRRERRIAAVYRGCGPLGLDEPESLSFDRHLLDLAVSEGARHRLLRAESIDLDNGRPRIQAGSGFEQSYDLMVVATGVNSPFMRMVAKTGLSYRPPKVAQAYISEFTLGRGLVDTYLGSAMHVFLLDIPHLEFAAIIPKRRHATLCLLGSRINPELIQAFVESPEVKRCMPPLWRAPDRFCRCSPRINVGSVVRPFADRVVLIGDCAATRLYKDGIGAAYRTGKAAATAALYHGISASDFARWYWPVCRSIERDNGLGRVVFGVTRQIRSRRWARRALWRTVSSEQNRANGGGRMSSVLWDTFTGSASYRSVLSRTLHPAVLGSLVGESMLDDRSLLERIRKRRRIMKRDVSGLLGRYHKDGEVIYRQGERGDSIFIVQGGKVEMLRRHDDKEFCLEILEEGDFFGERALFETDVRSCTARAHGECWVLTLERKSLLRDMQHDPSLSLRIMEKLAQRLRDRDSSLVRLGARGVDV